MLHTGQLTSSSYSYFFLCFPSLPILSLHYFRPETAYLQKWSLKPDFNLGGLRRSKMSSLVNMMSFGTGSQAPCGLGTSLRNNIRTQQLWRQRRERQWQRVYWRRPTPSVKNDRDRDTLLTIHSLRVHLAFAAKIWLPRFWPIKLELERYRRAQCRPASASIKRVSSSAEAIRARF